MIICRYPKAGCRLSEVLTMQIMKCIHRIVSGLLAAVMAGTLLLPSTAAASEEMAHDPARDVQTQGVGNPFGYGERNTPADASTEEIRAINHAMSVQEVKYALYKEIDEHWNLISVRLGQTDREKVYALFLGIGTRESTLGGNGDGADIETAQGQGFGVSSAHAYGTLQTAVTAFADADPTFMKEEDVPEMYQYSLTEANFYDAIVSNHMGIRKIMHFVHVGMTQDGLEGYQVVRGALKGFNTGWSDYSGEEGYYKNYPDEIIALARWYYEEGHLYDSVFTWTGDQRVDYCREGDVWAWWGDGVPSLAEITETTLPSETDVLRGDVNLDQKTDLTDIVALQRHLVKLDVLQEAQFTQADMDENGHLDILDLALLKHLVFSE